MFVVTDGSPNNPPGDPLTDSATWLTGGDAAIGEANQARSAGYVVEAVYLSTAGDPGDTTLPFSDSGDAAWAQAVMTRIGGGSYLNSDFKDFIDDLFAAIGCEPPSVEITKTADPGGPVTAGGQIGFTIAVTNNGGEAAHGVTVTDSLPGTAGLDWSISPAVAGCSISGALGSEVLTCNFGTLNVKETKSVHVVSGTTAASCSTIENTASFDTSDDGSGEASASVTVQCPDVRVTKTPNAGTVQAGDNAVFTILVENLGPGSATNVTLSDTLPVGYTWTEDSADCAIANGILSCNFGTLAQGAAGNRTIHLSAPTSAQSCATIPNAATVAAGNEDQSKLGNNSDGASIDVLCGAISIVKTANPVGPVSAGDPIGFDITVTNNGDGEARGVHVSDTLPTTAGLAWTEDSASCSIAGGILTCDYAAIPAGESRTVHLTSPTTPASCTTIENTASVSTTNDGSGSSTASVVVQCPNIEVAKEAVSEPMSAGDPVGFRVTIRNVGLGTAHDAQATDELDPASPAGRSSAPPTAGSSRATP